MKKTSVIILTILLAVFLSLSVTGVNAVNWTADESELAKWTKVSDGGNSTVTIATSDQNLVGDNTSSVKVNITKTGDAIGGVSADISEKMSQAINDYEAVLGVRISFYNAVALEDDSMVVKFGAGTEEWTVVDTQTAERTLQTLDTVGNKTVTVSFAAKPENIEIADLDSITIAVSGENNAELYIGEVALMYSDAAVSPAQKTLVPTTTSIGLIGFGNFQYGGTDGTTTAKVVENDPTKSKETDGSSLKVNVSGDGSTANRVYSVFFPLAAQKSSLMLQNPVGITFWVYNNVEGGGLLFIAGNEITSGIKVYDANNSELTEKENNRDLDFTGFRRYEIALNATQIAANELEIGIWGASVTSCYNLSAFSFVDMATPVIGDIALPSVSELLFGNFSTTNSMERLSGKDSACSNEVDGSYVGIKRNESAVFDISSVYMQSFANVISSSQAAQPKSISFDVYNKTILASGGLLFKFSGDEEGNVSWVDGNDIKGTGRDLDFVGFRRYTVALSSSRILANEMELGVWGTSAAEVYFSNFTVYDEGQVTVDASGSCVLVEASVEKYTVVEASFTSNVELKDNAIHFTVIRNGSKGVTYIERAISDLFTADQNIINISLKADADYGKDGVLAIDVIYQEATGVSSRYRVISSVVFDETTSVVEFINTNDLPYFITSENIKGLRLTHIGNLPEVGIAVDSITCEANAKVDKKAYSFLVSDFDNASDFARWKVSYASGTSAIISYTTDAKVGTGALAYQFSNPLYDFGWTETYLDVSDIITKNIDKDIKGISFWMYNETYVEPGRLGFWLKVAQTDSLEFEAKYTSIISENITGNNLGYTGWQKIEIPFDAVAYTEQNYNTGYNASAPRSFDWTKLAYIKIGYWGTYYDAELDYSCNTKIDDVRFVSTKQLSVEPANHNIIYVLNGGTLDSSAKTTYTEGSEYTLPTPTREGYKFIGWYTNGGLTGEKITTISATERTDKTFYAAYEVETSGENKGLSFGIIALSAGAITLAAGVILILSRKKKKV